MQPNTELAEIAGILIKVECLLDRHAGPNPPRWLKHATVSVGDAIQAIEEYLKEEEVDIEASAEDTRRRWGAGIS